MFNGENIKAYRHIRGMTIAELAEHTHSSKSYIWGVENNTIAHPSINKIIMIAQALGVSVNELLLPPHSSFSAQQSRIRSKR